MTDTLMTAVVLPPWRKADAADEALTTELHRELGRGHVLFAATAQLLARRTDQDDALFVVPGLPKPFAVVRLTWRGRREDDPQWPRTILYASLREWEETCMKPDHDEHEGASTD